MNGCALQANIAVETILKVEKANINAGLFRVPTTSVRNIFETSNVKGLSMPAALSRNKLGTGSVCRKSNFKHSLYPSKAAFCLGSPDGAMNKAGTGVFIQTGCLSEAENIVMNFFRTFVVSPRASNTVRCGMVDGIHGSGGLDILTPLWDGDTNRNN